jgi:uncharacterized alkaline shock family protein YloU
VFTLKCASNEHGDVLVDDNIVVRMIGFCALECYGIVGMAVRNIKDGVAQLLQKENLTKGIKIYTEKNNDDKSFDEINIELHIILEYGTNVKAVADSLHDTIRYKISKTLGIAINKINIFVESIRIKVN